MPRSVVSLFTGAGGLDLGFEAGGFRTGVAVEMDAACVDTLRANRDWPVIHEDVLKVTSSEILASAELPAGEIDLLIGGPPCQPFSKSGYWSRGDSRRLDDPRADTLAGYLRVLRDTQPRAFLLENVAGLNFKGKSEALDLLRDEVERINKSCGTRYGLEIIKLNAADFGVPQIRERVFILGSREGRQFGRLDATHDWATTQSKGGEIVEPLPKLLEPYRSAWDAIGHLADQKPSDDLAMRGKWAALLPSVPEGQNYLYHTDRGEGLPLFGWRRRFWNFLLKLAKDQPSWTLTAQPGPATGPFHWQNRHLSPRELARLQTFPDNYHLPESRIIAQKQIGNAVPSALAELLALRIRSRFFGETKLETAIPSLIPAKRDDCPVPEKVLRVRKSYRDLVGEHSAHPGTGLGYGAQRRAS